jgi:hypothetical protein
LLIAHQPSEFVMSIVLAAFALAAQPAEAPPRLGLLRFSVVPARRRGSAVVDVGRIPPDRGLHHFSFRRTAPNADRPSPTRYANTITCPAARAPLEALEDLALPGIDVPAIGREPTEIILDGADYRIAGRVVHADGQPGEFELSSNVGSPLARWIDSMMAALEPCWQADPAAPVMSPESRSSAPTGSRPPGTSPG